MTIINMTYGQWNAEATITWTDPSNLVVDWQTLATWSSTKLVRKVGSAPSSSSDWTLVLTETVADTYSVNGYTDTGLTNETTYYYWAFAVADNWLETISSTTPNVTPTAQWQPNANTMLYCPLKTDIADYSLSPKTPETSKSVPTFTINWWIQCALFNSNYFSYVINDSGMQNFTVSMFLSQTNTSWRNIATSLIWINMQTRNPNVWIHNGKWWFTWWNGDNEDGSATQNWTNIILTSDNSAIKLYVNWILQITQTTIYSSSVITFADIWKRKQQYDNNEYYDGYMSEYILEDKVRTAQEILNYYNQTKWNYGL